MTDTGRMDGHDGKVCTRCGEWKLISEFHKNKNKAFGHAYHCRDCDKKRKAEYRARNPERIRELARAEYENNREKRRASHRKWAEANPEKMREAKRRCRQTPKGRVEANVRGHIHKAIRKGYKFKRTFEALGYTVEQLMVHLERQFTNGMCWENYGEWHIDHKIPNSLFNYNSTEDIDFKRAWALSNLQPLWAGDNMKKSDKHDGGFQPSFSFAPANDNSPQRSRNDAA